MINLQSFVLGTLSGIYIAQNYDIPNVKIISDKVIEYIKDLEKKD